MLVRKQVGNPPDYFDKTFAEYQRGFTANGEFLLERTLTKYSSRRDLDRPRRASPLDQQKILLAKHHNDRLWWNHLCGCLWPVQGYIKSNWLTFAILKTWLSAKKIVFWSPHRSVQGTIMFSQLLGSTPPSQHSGTPCRITMGWSSAPSKSNFDTIWKSSEWN